MASATSSSGASPEQLTGTSDQTTNKAFSCVLCAQRKVKCDKRPGGCHNCIKARVPCIYKAPPPPRRRRKGIRDLDTTTKLRIYETALRKAGIDPESLLQQTLSHEPSNDNNQRAGKISNRILAQPTEQAGPTDIGVLVTDQGKSRYLENGIWTSLRSEFRNLKEILDDTSEDDSSNGDTGLTPEAFSLDVSRLMFGNPVSSIGLRPLHPRPVEAFKLWQAYLDNVNPLIKLFHAPTVQQIISEASGNLDAIPRNVEALLFAIYCIAVESLSDGECTLITGESKPMARQRFRTGAQQALINASFLKTSDLMVLQALTLFVVSGWNPKTFLNFSHLTQPAFPARRRRSYHLDVVWYVPTDWSTHRFASRWRHSQAPALRSRDSSTTMVADCHVGGFFTEACWHRHRHECFHPHGRC